MSFNVSPDCFTTSCTSTGSSRKDSTMNVSLSYANSALCATHGVASFRTGVDAVEHRRLRFEVEAETLEVLVPVRVLDNDLDARVLRLRGPDHELPGDVL